MSLVSLCNLIAPSLLSICLSFFLCLCPLCLVYMDFVIWSVKLKPYAFSYQNKKLTHPDEKRLL